MLNVLDPLCYQTCIVPLGMNYQSRDHHRALRKEVFRDRHIYDAIRKRTLLIEKAEHDKVQLKDIARTLARVNPNTTDDGFVNPCCDDQKMQSWSAFSSLVTTEHSEEQSVLEIVACCTTSSEGLCHCVHSCTQLLGHRLNWAKQA